MSNNYNFTDNLSGEGVEITDHSNSFVDDLADQQWSEEQWMEQGWVEQQWVVDTLFDDFYQEEDDE